MDSVSRGSLVFSSISMKRFSNNALYSVNEKVE